MFRRVQCSLKREGFEIVLRMQGDNGRGSDDIISFELLEFTFDGSEEVGAS